MHKTMAQGALLTSALLLMTGTVAVAADQPAQNMNETSSVQTNDQVTVLEGRMSLGYLTDNATELTYLPWSGYKISELDWKTDPVLMLTLGGSIQPKHWLRFNGDLQFKLTDGENSMNDYDWMVPGMDWTDWSQHNDVDLTSGYVMDFNIEFPVLHLGEQTTSSTSFSLFAGFITEKWEWEASGGSYVYSENGFRDTIGIFDPAGKEITYNQKFNTPYLGVGFSSRLNNLDLHGRIIFSELVHAEDHDQHHQRGLIFASDCKHGEMLGGNLGFAYRFTPQWAVTADVQYLEYSEVRGVLDITDIRTGQSLHVDGDASGIKSSRTSVALGMRYQF